MIKFELASRSFGKTKELIKRQAERIEELETAKKYWKNNFNFEFKSHEKTIKREDALKEKLEEILKENSRIKRLNESYLNDLIKYEKEIKEQSERIEGLLATMEKRSNIISTLKQACKESNRDNDYLKKCIESLNKDNDKIIKSYLIKKYNLLVDQKAPKELLELINNLIKEINS